MINASVLSEEIPSILTKRQLQHIFPLERSGEFFEALFGDASEGAYDIELAYRTVEEMEEGASLVMELRLNQRPGCCLVCNLTAGLPQVFSRHPIIDIEGIVAAIDSLLGEVALCKEWSLGRTEQKSNALHIIPLYINIR